MNAGLDLFGNAVLDTPATEGIKYAGSKRKLLPHILRMVDSVSPKSVLDAFSGTTRVSQALAQSGYVVHANDQAVWSKVFATCYLKNSQPASYYRPILEHLNALDPIDGWFTENYGGNLEGNKSIGVDGLKKPWQIHNTRKLDAIRLEIDRLGLPDVEKSVLLTSLIYALDEVDSTLGHFASYLSEWSARSYKTMSLKIPTFFGLTKEHHVSQADIFDILPAAEVDLAYFDPPYGSNNEKMPPSRVRYSAYYHVWTSICLNDMPDIFGKAKRRADTSDATGSSIFEEFRRSDTGRFIALEAIRRALNEVKAKHILLSYSSGGRATAEELYSAINEVGKLVDVQEIDHRRNIMASMRWTNEWIRDSEKPNTEFLFLIKKR